MTGQSTRIAAYRRASGGGSQLVVAASGVVALAQPGCKPSCCRPADLDSYTDSAEEDVGEADDVPDE